jgi:hypothetical protein
MAQTIQLLERNSAVEVKQPKLAFWGVNNKNTPKGVSQPK